MNTNTSPSHMKRQKEQHPVTSLLVLDSRIRTHTRARKRTNTHARVCERTDTRTHKITNTNTYTNANANTDTNKHTHIPSLPPSLSYKYTHERRHTQNFNTYGCEHMKKHTWINRHACTHIHAHKPHQGNRGDLATTPCHLCTRLFCSYIMSHTHLSSVSKFTHRRVRTHERTLAHLSFNRDDLAADL